MKNPRKISRLFAAVILILVVTLSSSIIFLEQNLNTQMMASNTAITKMDVWGDIASWANSIASAIESGVSRVFSGIFSFGSSEWGVSLTNYYRMLVIDVPPSLETFNYNGQTPMLDLFYKMRDLSFLFFTLVLVFAGLCYLLENFRLMNEGTAFGMLTNSMFTLIIIYLLPDLYLVLSSGFNAITNWILTPVIGPAFPFSADPIALLGGQVSGAGLFNPFMALFVMTTSATCILLGIMRYVIFYGVVVFMPVALVLRLIPFTQRIGDDIVQALIGFFMAALLSALIVEVGATTFCFYRMGGAMPAFFASAVLLAGAFIPTLFIPRLGGLFTAATMAAAGAAAGAGQFVQRSLSGTLLGGIGGGVGGAVGGGAEAQGAAGEVTTGGSSGVLGRAKLLMGQAGIGAAKGVVSGAAEGAMRGRKMGPYMLTAGLKTGLLTGSENTRASMEQTATKNTGNLMDYFAYNPTEADSPTADAEGDAYKAQIGHATPEKVGSLLLTQTGLDQSPLANAEGMKRMGGAYQTKLAGFDNTNANRVKAGMANYQSLLLSGKQAECDKLVKTANEFAKRSAGRTEVMRPPSPKFDSSKSDETK